MNSRQKSVSSCFVVIAALLFAASFEAALAQTAPSLGFPASTFAVLGSSTVTCTGLSTITGDLGVSPGSAVTGFPAPCTVVGGAIHAADAVALQRSEERRVGNACRS